MLTSERILLIGDTQRQMYGVAAAALPGADVVSVGNYFDAIAELQTGQYTAVLAAVEPIERRPEAAVRTLRQLAGTRRILLFGHPTLEPLSRKMLDFGGDDYIVTPADPRELQQMFGSPPLRLSRDPSSEAPGDAPANEHKARLTALADGSLAHLLLESLLH
jgi:DNA-binding response OmpR family regulator